jgi:predicted HAD superfamily Cof-like phosphohydrolase
MKARITAMNEKYELPVNSVPRFQGFSRLYHFRSILEKEVSEIDDIIDSPVGTEEVDLLTGVADLLADIVVYCQSEAVRYGIPLEEVLHIVMDSNDTKLGADGKPIKDSDGKFLKGPNFVPPEPAIRKLLLEKMNENN